MTRADRSLTINIPAEAFEAIDLLGGRYGLSPAEFLRRTALHIATLSDNLAHHGRETANQ